MSSWSTAAGRRPRPVADAPSAEPAAIAKAWLIELVVASPLDAAAAIPTAELARDAPELCAALHEALWDDAALDRLAPGGDLVPLAARAARFAGAGDPAAAVAAVEALRTAMLQTLAVPPGELALALGDRLAHACTLVAAAAAASASAASPASVTALASSAAPAEPAAGPGPPWVDAVERRLERFRSDRTPFAVVAIEVDDADRLLAAQADGEVEAAFDAIAQQIAAALRPADVLLRERPGRHWLIAPETTQDDARLLATQIARGASAAPGHHGVPLRLSAGIAACPRDGTGADALLGTAEEGLFAARAAGLTVA